MGEMQNYCSENKGKRQGLVLILLKRNSLY